MCDTGLSDSHMAIGPYLHFMEIFLKVFFITYLF